MTNASMPDQNSFLRGKTGNPIGSGVDLSEGDCIGQSNPSNWMVCKSCEEVDTPVESMPGNGWVEAILYLFYIAPGVIYSVWRRKGKKKVCSACGSSDVVPAASRAGRRILGDTPINPTSALRRSPRTKVVAPTFGKLSAILMGGFALGPLLGGAAILYVSIFNDRDLGLAGVGFAIIAIGAILVFAASKMWCAKPRVVNL